jgi:tetratricopeptide (TPR) repeat protein
LSDAFRLANLPLLIHPPLGLKNSVVALRSQKNRQIALLCLLLAAATLAVYWPVRLNDFVNYDDGEYITSNPHLQHGLTWSSVAWAFRTGYASNWHPLTWLSHMLDVQMFGLHPADHHLTNVLFHSANTVLLFLLLVRATCATWRSAFVAALFALHPLHVESVAWASERKDVLSAFFGLLCLLAYARYVEQSKVQGAESKVQGPMSKVEGGAPTHHASRITHHVSLFYLLSLFLFALALLSKPMLVTLPFVMLLLDYWPLRRLSFPILQPSNPPPLRLLREKLPFFLLSALSSIVTCLAQHGAMSYYRGLPFSLRAANAIVSSARYLGKALWPRHLAVFYSHPERWLVWQTVGAAILLAVLTALALWCLRRRPYLAVGWFWFLGMLVPVLGLVQVGMQSMADRYTYLPLVGIFIILAWAAAEGLTAARLPAWLGALAGVALLAACGAGTRSQIRVWRNTETLFTHAAAVTPDNWVAHNNLAIDDLMRYLQSEHGSLEKQLVQLDAPLPASAQASPDSRERLAETIRHCEAALQIRPRNVTTRVTLAKALMECGQLDDACAHLEIAVRLSPTNVVAHQNYAEVLHRQGRAKEAIAQYQATLQLEPDWDSLLNNLAWLLATHPSADVRDGAQAVRLAGRACQLTSSTNLWYLHTLAAAYAETGDFAQAVPAAEQARRLAAASGQSNLIATAEQRLQLYRSHQPYRER